MMAYDDTAAMLVVSDNLTIICLYLLNLR